jgi:hypothetical protein
MFDFFEKLREDRKLDESLELLKVITDSGIRSRMQAVLALHFSGIDDMLPLFESMVSSSLDGDPVARRHDEGPAPP